MGDIDGGRPGKVRWGVFFFEGVPRLFLRRLSARPRGLELSSSPASESLASEWEMGEEEGESDQEGVTYSCCCCCCCCRCCRWAVRERGSSSCK